MKDIVNIEFTDLLLGFASLIIPLSVFLYYRTGMLKDTLIAVIRMSVQLFLVGLYLEFIFKLNNAWINILWVVIMIIVAAFTIVRRSGLNLRFFVIPAGLSILTSVFIVDTWFLGLVIKLDYTFESRYFIPITGMILGNSLNSNIISLRTFYHSLRDKLSLYQYNLSFGASKNEALSLFYKDALQNAFNPMIATISVIGLISLPGMMTGQILGGSSPAVAIRYQIMIMLTIFISSVISVVLTLILSNLFVFDEYDNPRINRVFKL